MSLCVLLLQVLELIWGGHWETKLTTVACLCTFASSASYSRIGRGRWALKIVVERRVMGSSILVLHAPLQHTSFPFHPSFLFNSNLGMGGGHGQHITRLGGGSRWHIVVPWAPQWEEHQRAHLLLWLSLLGKSRECTGSLCSWSDSAVETAEDTYAQAGTQCVDHSQVRAILSQPCAGTMEPDGQSFSTWVDLCLPCWKFHQETRRFPLCHSDWSPSGEVADHPMSLVDSAPSLADF